MQTMANVLFDNVCRLCTIQNKRNDMIYLFQGSNIIEMFSRCTSLEANQSDGLPAYMCKECHNLLTSYYNFRLLCTSSDTYFRQKILVKLEKSENEVLQQPTAVEAAADSAAEAAKPYQSDAESIVLSNQSSDAMKNESAENNSEQSITDGKMDISNYKQEESDEYSDENDDDPSYVVPDAPSSGEGSNDHMKHKRKKLISKKSKQNEVLSCSLCPKKFFKKHRLEAHIRQHKGLKPCVCGICNKEFSKFSGLAQHMNVAHTENAKSFVCDYENCNRTYSMRQSLNVHKRKAHSTLPNDQPVEASFMCELCGKSFTTNSSLKKHTYTHTGLMPFKCSICPKKYATKHKLKEHIMRHEGVKNHICPFCGLRKTTQHELKVHINYHTREKLYPCKLCSAVFSSIGNMSRHVKIVHCGIKAFDCTFCERSFGKAETLKHHIMTHTGEKPHGCSVCGKRFIQAIALQTHMKTHTKAARP